jgi:hypothetical protein
MITCMTIFTMNLMVSKVHENSTYFCLCKVLIHVQQILIVSFSQMTKLSQKFIVSNIQSLRAYLNVDYLISMFI